MSDSFQADGAVVQLIANHQKDMMHYVYSLTLNWSDAEDVIQETNVRLWEQRDDYDTTKPNGQPRRCVSNEMAEQKIGFIPKMSLEDGLKKIIAWHKSQNFS